MTDLNRQNLSFYRCTVFIRELFQRGVRHLVISPGSRSTPLTLAAAAHPGMKKHVILDERSAAFTALGIGKYTGKPAVLICTSGTAAANYYPAVIEAYQSGVPLVLATADRPPELRNTDANQTIDQIELFGKFVLSFRDVSEPSGDDPELNSIIEITGNSFEESLNGKGPVHLNFPFTKPLEPEKGFVETIVSENETLANKTDTHFAKEQYSTGTRSYSKLYPILDSAKKPLIIIGQLPAGVAVKPIIKLAENLNCPVLSEMGCHNSSNYIQGFEGFLRNNEVADQLSPDLILRFGLQPASKSLLLALDLWKPDHHIYVKPPSEKKETSLQATDTLEWNGDDFAAEALSGAQSYWLDQWQEAAEKYKEYKNRLANHFTSLTDGHVYEHLSSQLPPDWWIFFSNSFPARDRSMFGQWKGQEIYTNRGASGIDGVSSTHIGIGIASSKPGILFTGDLAFLHDSNALLNSRLLSSPLVIVVINNKGGSIFRMLPIASHEAYFDTYFETPQQVDISQLCASHNLHYQKIESKDQLAEFHLHDFLEDTDGFLHVIEFRTDPDASMQLRRKLWMQE